ncbi:unnamed protein product, partial [Pocillopora meandrina]
LLLSAVNIFFSLTAFFGNSLIFVALHKISSIHAPSKLLYRCLATTDLLVGLVSQPLVATLWMSVVHEQWRLSRWFGRIIISSCLLISITSYAKIFRALRRHQAQIQDHVQHQPSQLNAPNMGQYRKAVYSALWVQLALLACYVPVSVEAIVMAHRQANLSHLVVALGIANTIVNLNSTLNPFLYCWKISEVRQAVKQTIRQALCCPWT